MDLLEKELQKAVDTQCYLAGLSLNIMDNAIQQHASHEELKDLTREIDRDFTVTNSEWARLQLKITEFVYSKAIKFDYMQNNWHLYLQIQIANWLLFKDDQKIGG